MATAVADAITRVRHLVIQAGTGTGKSLSYLVPAVLSGQKVAVVTATKGLQDQLVGQDLPVPGQAARPATSASPPSRAAPTTSASSGSRRSRPPPTQGTLAAEGIGGKRRRRGEGRGRQAPRVGRHHRPTATSPASPSSPRPGPGGAMSVSSEECPGGPLPERRALLRRAGPGGGPRRRGPRRQHPPLRHPHRRRPGRPARPPGRRLRRGPPARGGHLRPPPVSRSAPAASAPSPEPPGPSSPTPPSRWRSRAPACAFAQAMADHNGAAGRPRQARRPRREGPPPPGQAGRGPAQDRHRRRRRRPAGPGPRVRWPASSRTSTGPSRRPRATSPGSRAAGVAGAARSPRRRRLRLHALFESTAGHPHLAPPSRPAWPPGSGYPRTAPASSTSAAPSTTSTTPSCAAHLPDPATRPTPPPSPTSWSPSSPPPAAGPSPSSPAGGPCSSPSKRCPSRVSTPMLAQEPAAQAGADRRLRRRRVVVAVRHHGLLAGHRRARPHAVVRRRRPHPVFPRARRPAAPGPRVTSSAGGGPSAPSTCPGPTTLLAQSAGRLIRTANDRGVVAVLDPRLAKANYRWDVVSALPPMKHTAHRAESRGVPREIAEVVAAGRRSPPALPRTRQGVLPEGASLRPGSRSARRRRRAAARTAAARPARRRPRRSTRTAPSDDDACRGDDQGGRDRQQVEADAAEDGAGQVDPPRLLRRGQGHGT